MAYIISLIVLLISDVGVGFVVNSNIDLPLPPGADSSLSPKLIKAFYEINFSPAEMNGIQNRLGEATVETNANDCTLSPKLCKHAYFFSTKVKTVQKVDDMIKLASSSGDVPVVKGYKASESEVAEIMKTINETVNKVVPTNQRKFNSTPISPTEVPVYKGLVNTREILDRTEKPQVSFRHPPMPPRFHFHIPYPNADRPQYDAWRRNGPCMAHPCPHVWHQRPNIGTRI